MNKLPYEKFVHFRAHSVREAAKKDKRDATIAAALKRVTGDAADLSNMAGRARDDLNSSRFSEVRGTVRSLIHWYALKIPRVLYSLNN